MDQNILKDLFDTQGHINEEELNAYLSDNVPDELRRKVENTLLDNPLLSDAVEGYQEMGLTALPAFEDFSDFKKKLPAPEGAKTIQLTPAQKFMRMAAVAVGLLLAVLAYSSLQSSSPDSLYSDFYSSYENDISLARRGDAELLQRDFKYALGLYATGDFVMALPGFKRAIAAEPENDAARFFAGMACLETGNAAQAIDFLTTVKNNEGTYAHKAHWYAVLATLKNGNMAEAKMMLDDFMISSSYKKAEAKKLMSKL